MFDPRTFLKPVQMVVCIASFWHCNLNLLKTFLLYRSWERLSVCSTAHSEHLSVITIINSHTSELKKEFSFPNAQLTVISEFFFYSSPLHFLRNCRDLMQWELHSPVSLLLREVPLCWGSPPQCILLTTSQWTSKIQAVEEAPLNIKIKHSGMWYEVVSSGLKSVMQNIWKLNQ